ncbi:MAG: hypothetical protein ABL961_10880 [Vicinamibacterales bacterium]
MMRSRSVHLLIAGAMGLYVASVLRAQRSDAFTASRDHLAIQYSTRPVDTSITALNRDLDAGRVHLTFEPVHGYLPSLLSALGVPVESQLLVFSETSAQASLITPANPRAIFFNDSTAVAWVRGADTLELAAHDPSQGTIFYQLDQKVTERPRLVRQDGCLECHLTWDTLGVPGWSMISTFPMSDDKNAYATGVTVDHRTYLDQRWGGWFVTGKAVPARHYGNLPVIRTARELALPTPRPPVLTSVAGRFDGSGHISPYSDVVASLVLGHQAHMINLLTRIGWEARVAEQDKTSAEKATAQRLQEAARDVVDYMLFIDEARLPQKIEGSSGFAEKFSGQGPLDSHGRSLRQFDLERRVFRYPCSYMVYSPAFDALPPLALDAVYRRLWVVLSGQETGKEYVRLSLADRTAIAEILRETKKNLPAYFQAVTR